MALGLKKKKSMPYEVSTELLVIRALVNRCGLTIINPRSVYHTILGLYVVSSSLKLSFTAGPKVFVNSSKSPVTANVSCAKTTVRGLEAVNYCQPTYKTISCASVGIWSNLLISVLIH